MEIQRSLIFLGLAIVSYLLILAWVEDYGDQPSAATTASVAENPVLPGDIPVGNPADDQPAGEESIPVATSAPEQASVAEVSNTDPVASRLIRINTDTYEILLDPKGGKIVRLSLPQYPVSVKQPDVPFPLLQTDDRYYIAQFGLTGFNGLKESDLVYQSSQPVYSLTGDTLEVTLTAKSGSLEFTKQYRFQKGRYLFDVTQSVRNLGEQPLSVAQYGRLVRDHSKDPSAGGGFLAAMPTYLGVAYWDPEKPYNKYSLSDMEDSNLDKSHKGGWIAFLQHYFVNAFVPPENETNRYWTRFNPASNLYTAGFSGAPVSVAPQQEHQFQTRFYSGPKIQEVLEQVSPGLELTVDYGWLWMISQPLFAVLDFLHNLLGNWGLAIISLTLLIKLAFFKLSANAYRSMANMRKFAPRIKQLQEQYKNDRQKLSQEMMELYRKEKINPLGGCLPILVQMPVFLALYYVLLESVELRQAPFYGWIQDLSVMDPYFVLPILMVASMVLQMRLNPEPPDPMQAKVMKMMPFVFGVFFLFFPAGLVLYWVVNNLLSIAQQYVITRRIEQG